MHSLLIPGTALAGLLIGGALDPVGQRLADRSWADEERRRAERDEERQGSPDAADQAVPADTVSAAVPVAIPELDVADQTLRHLLPAGRSPARTVGAALVTGVLFGACAHHFGRDVVLAPFCVFFATLVAVSVTDLSHRLVPRHLLYAGMALVVPLLVLTSAVDHQWRNLSGSAIAGAVAFSLFFAIWWFVPRGMGFGDVRLAGAIGITVGYLSLLHAYVAFLAGFLVGMVFGLVLLAVSSAGRRTRIPFAPSLAIGAVIAVLWGGHVAQSLFHVGN